MCCLQSGAANMWGWYGNRPANDSASSNLERPLVGQILNFVSLPQAQQKQLCWSDQPHGGSNSFLPHLLLFIYNLFQVSFLHDIVTHSYFGTACACSLTMTNGKCIFSPALGNVGGAYSPSQLTGASRRQSLFVCAQPPPLVCLCLR